MARKIIKKPRGEKTEAVARLLRREVGATIKEMENKTGWWFGMDFLEGVARSRGMRLVKMDRSGKRFRLADKRRRKAKAEATGVST